MADTLSRQARSENMRRIRSTDTFPELIVRRIIHALGYRFRLHVKSLPGNPDIVLPRHGAIIQVHGCFWHGHERCIDSHIPATNRRYWSAKLKGNVERDQRNLRKLRRLGWRVLTIWECQTKAPERIRSRIAAWLRKKHWQ